MPCVNPGGQSASTGIPFSKTAHRSPNLSTRRVLSSVKVARRDPPAGPQGRRWVERILTPHRTLQTRRRGAQPQRGCNPCPVASVLSPAARSAAPSTCLITNGGLIATRP